MKDLQGHSTISHSFGDDDSENMIQPPQHPLLDQLQEKSISDDMMEGNPFDCAVQYRQQANNFINYCKNNNPHQSINKPTEGNGKNIINYHDRHPYSGEDVHGHDADDDDNFDHLQQHHHYNHQREQDNHHHPPIKQGQEQVPRSRPVVAASSPIQVPARRTRKDFYSMKLNMMKVEESAALAAAVATDDSTSSTATEDSEDFSPVRRGDRNRPAIENMPAFDEDDAFLDREFNENHYNHYLLDGLDDEHLTAEEDPMRLFASIQALAKSLHEDAELFGSLPPKRLLESPIRSIAFV